MNFLICKTKIRKLVHILNRFRILGQQQKNP